MKRKNRLLVILTLMIVLPVGMMLIMGMSKVTNNDVPNRPDGPGDIFTAAGFPCVTAHSTTRALYSTYNGPLYQVMRESDGKTMDIGVVQPSEGDPGGYADAAAQDAFCKNTVCWITIIYDQSGNNNHLVQAPPGTFRGPAKGGFNTLPIADMAPITVMGHKVYGTFIMPGAGLRNNNAIGLAINDEPQGVYMVCDGTHYDHGCCFNYGNTSTNSRAVGRGTMSTVYFGTATAWGRGSGPGPWIMSDMEAGLFSGYNTKLNISNPTIDSWRFVTGMVNGGGGNQWEIRGGNAQEGELTTFYKGIRPQSLENKNYYPMHQKGAVQLGNGGDNGNGSSGTFYEGVMTSGYPTDDAIHAVQANIVAAGYDVSPVSLSRTTTFTPGIKQYLTFTYTNTTDGPVNDLKLSVILPSGWTSEIAGQNEKSISFSNRIEPGASVNATFTIGSPASTGAGYLTGKAEWKNQTNGKTQSEITSQRIRNSFPVKINEVRLSYSSSPAEQFIELYNASSEDVDISNWSLINTKSEWAPVKLATIPSRTKLAANDFYLLWQSGTGLAAPANKGENTIHVLNTNNLKAGQHLIIGGETHKIKSIGTPASEMTAIFVPVPTGPWITIPAGSTNIPVISVSGFEVGQKIGIDLGGNYEEATITEVGKASTLTNLAVEAKAGDNIIKVNANSNMTVGDMLTIGTGARKELIKVKRLINTVEAPARGFFRSGGNTTPGEVELDSPLKFDHMLDVDVCDAGTGISFSPATRYEHKSGDAVQALGSGIILESVLGKSHEVGAAILNDQAGSENLQGSVSPNLWFGAPLSIYGGSIALMDASGKIIVDAMVYGSPQTNSGANGTITSPELATLEGIQKQSGCIVVVPGVNRSNRLVLSSLNHSNKSVGRFPDGADTDSNCNDFQQQNTITLLLPSKAGSNNISVGSVGGLSIGQKVFIGTGKNIETAVIKTIGTPGGTTLSSATEAGETVISVASVEGFNIGQVITIDSGVNRESAVIASISTERRRFFSDNGPPSSITVAMPLKDAHAEGVQISGSGIIFTTSLSNDHDIGTHVASNVPTPGEPNQYTSRQ